MYESSQADCQKVTFPRLLGDIGGTHARFGWQWESQGELDCVQVLPCAEHASLSAAIQAYLRSQNLPSPAWAALGIANPVVGDSVAMTNHHWRFSVSALRQSLGAKRLLLLNDFTALALSLPTLEPSSKRLIDPHATTLEVPDATLALLGPGTGLGVSGLVKSLQQWVPISGEGGHVTLSAASAAEFALVEALQKRFGHVSAERVLSGQGLLDLNRAWSEVKGEAVPAFNHPAEVLEAARAHPHSTAHQTVQSFVAFLASVAGDLALTLGARGGVYLGGGILPRLGPLFDPVTFRHRFEAKGRFNTYLQAIPVWQINSAVSPALQGAAQALLLASPHLM
jgi:glucokinase